MDLKGYTQISDLDQSGALDAQRDALMAAGVREGDIHSDVVSTAWERRPNLDACLKMLRAGDVLVVCSLDHLAHNLRHLVKIVNFLAESNVGLRVLKGQGIAIDTTSANGETILAIFTALAECEREIVSARERFGAVGARTRGRKDPKMTAAMIRAALLEMQNKGTIVANLCKELGINRSTLYRYISPRGELRAMGRKVIDGYESSLPNHGNHLKEQVRRFICTVGAQRNDDKPGNSERRQAPRRRLFAGRGDDK